MIQSSIMIKCNMYSCQNEAVFFYLEKDYDPIAICGKCNERYFTTVKSYDRYTIEEISKEEYLKFK